MKITLEQFNSCDDIVKSRILSDLQSNADARRERAALQILPGIIDAEEFRTLPMEGHVQYAIGYADLLLKELDK